MRYPRKPHPRQQICPGCRRYRFIPQYTAPYCTPSCKRDALAAQHDNEAKESPRSLEVDTRQPRDVVSELQAQQHEQVGKMLDTEADETALFDQVRRLKAHHPHGGYVPVIVGYWDNRGYTRCPDCLIDPLAPRHRPLTAIYGDNCAAEGERCDSCGTGLLAAALQRS